MSLTTSFIHIFLKLHSTLGIKISKTGFLQLVDSGSQPSRQQEAVSSVTILLLGAQKMQEWKMGEQQRMESRVNKIKVGPIRYQRLEQSMIGYCDNYCRHKSRP